MNQELTLRDYFKVLATGKWIILAFVVAAIVIGALTSVTTRRTYTATSLIGLGQATSLAGAPVPTFATTPTTAPVVLKNTAIVESVAKEVGLSPTTVRSAVELTAPRLVASSGAQPTILTVTATHRKRATAIELANAYSDAIFGAISGPFTRNAKVLEERAKRTQALVDQLNTEVASLRKQMLAASTADRGVLQSALLSAGAQLSVAQTNAEDADLALGKALQVEAPQQLERATTATYAGSGGNRIRSTLFAALAGLLLGVIATFLWKGSPAGRARSAT